MPLYNRAPFSKPGRKQQGAPLAAEPQRALPARLLGRACVYMCVCVCASGRGSSSKMSMMLACVPLIGAACGSLAGCVHMNTCCAHARVCGHLVRSLSRSHSCAGSLLIRRRPRRATSSPARRTCSSTPPSAPTHPHICAPTTTHTCTRTRSLARFIVPRVEHRALGRQPCTRPRPAGRPCACGVRVRACLWCARVRRLTHGATLHVQVPGHGGAVQPVQDQGHRRLKLLQVQDRSTVQAWPSVWCCRRHRPYPGSMAAPHRTALPCPACTALHCSATRVVATGL